MLKLYRLALRLHSRAFRRRFAEEMEAVFGERLAAHRARRGTIAAGVFALRESLDVAGAALRRSSVVNAVPQTRPRPTMSTVLTDIAYALRQLRHRPGFALAAVLTLALAVGANTAVFSVVNGVLLRSLPYPDPERIVGVFTITERGGEFGAVSPLDWHDYARTGVFETIAAVSTSEMTVSHGGEAETLAGSYVTNDFFAVLKTLPALGRAFEEGDTNSDGETFAVVLSYGLWQQRFGGNPEIVGQSIRMDGKPRRVVGVMPAGFEYPRGATYWLPLRFSASDLRPNQRGALYLSAIARLKPGVTVEQADARIADLAARLAREHPRTNEGRGGMVRELHAVLVRDARAALIALLAAVLLVLLIACANVGNLFLARATGRQAEVAVRASLGATRGRLLQQFVVEGLTIAAIGGVVGVGLAAWATSGLLAFAPAQLTLATTAHLDRGVLLFSLAVTAGAGLLFGLAPSIHFLSRDAHALRERATTATPAQLRVQRLLIVGELALAIVLLVGAGLLVRSFVRLTAVDPGFDAAGVMTYRVSLPETRYAEPPSVLGYYERLTTEMESLPGVEEVGLIFGLPFGDLRLSSSFTIAERPNAQPEPGGRMTIVGGEYFRALRIPIRTGRAFDSRDTSDAGGVAIVNESAARRFWPGENPVGRRLRLHVGVAEWNGDPMRRIVGVVGDVRQRGLGQVAVPEIYIPFSQQPVGTAAVVARVRGTPTSILPAARARLRTLDPEVPMMEPMPLVDLLADSVADRRFSVLVLSAFAAAALLLAIVGVYSVMSYTVSQRTREMGVRLALGAAERDVLLLVIGQAVRLAASGIILGAASAVVVGRLLRSLLFEVNPADPLTIAGVVLTLGSAVLLASYVPARRATRVDPIATLRAD
jgi:putative ABC transport system permease protein